MSPYLSLSRRLRVTPFSRRVDAAGVQLLVERLGAPLGGHEDQGGRDVALLLGRLDELNQHAVLRQARGVRAESGCSGRGAHRECVCVRARL